MPIFSADYLKRAGIAIFKGAGAPDDEAEIVMRLLVKANLVGHDSHGVIRIPQYIHLIQHGDLHPGIAIEIVKETPSTAVINGNWGFGQVIASKAMEIAIQKAKTHSVSTVGAHHSNHVGRMADYAIMAAEENMIGMVMVNNHGAAQHVAPYGGKERRLSTNPICFAVPTGRKETSASQTTAEPLVVDITTSVVAEGKVRVARNRGQSIPEGWIIDTDGKPSTNPADLYADPPGAILPFGGIVAHKGFGLSLMVDILTGTISNAGFSRANPPRIGNAVFLTVINISSFMPIEEYLEQVDAFIEYVKSSKPMPGFDEVLVPGEPETRMEKKRLAEGIFVEDETWKQINDAAKSVGVIL
ncbi:TPA: Ldh family oxidoreductase [Candidatus Poribacteria bacterium]|nr:Ldh family oxidoreductase [Candidatus Poribacteria bacterium]